jgi:hypothetical protein
MTLSAAATTAATTATAAATTASAAPVTRPTVRRLTRAAGVAGAGVATAVLFGVGRAAGADFTITDPGQGAVPHTFGPVEITVAAVVCGLLGWASLAVLERCTAGAARWWTMLAVAVTVLSLVPIGIELATTGTRLMLTAIHLAVGAVLIPVLRRR